MDILFELFLPKDINLESFDLNEIFVEWAGEKYSQDPKQYQWKDFVCLLYTSPSPRDS